MDDRLKLQWIDGRRLGAAADPASLAGSPLTPADVPLVQRATRADRAIQSALDDVPVPAGLADRLLARLAESPAVASPGSVPPVAAPAAASGPVSRRRFVRNGLVASVGLGLAGLGGWALQHLLTGPPTPWVAEKLLNAAFDQFDQDLAEKRLPLADADLQTFPLPRSLVRGVCVGWSKTEFLSRTACCYHLQRGHRQGALWVAPLAGPRPAPAELGYRPLENKHSTAGKIGVVWRGPHVLYVAATVGGGVEELHPFFVVSETVT